MSRRHAGRPRAADSAVAVLAEGDCRGCPLSRAHRHPASEIPVDPGRARNGHHGRRERGGPREATARGVGRTRQRARRRGRAGTPCSALRRDRRTGPVRGAPRRGRRYRKAPRAPGPRRRSRRGRRPRRHLRRGWRMRQGTQTRREGTAEATLTSGYRSRESSTDGMPAVGRVEITSRGRFPPAAGTGDLTSHGTVQAVPEPTSRPHRLRRTLPICR